MIEIKPLAGELEGYIVEYACVFDGSEPVGIIRHYVGCYAGSYAGKRLPPSALQRAWRTYLSATGVSEGKQAGLAYCLHMPEFGAMMAIANTRLW